MDFISLDTFLWNLSLVTGSKIVALTQMASSVAGLSATISLSVWYSQRYGKVLKHVQNYGYNEMIFNIVWSILLSLSLIAGGMLLYGVVKCKPIMYKIWVLYSFGFIFVGTILISLQIWQCFYFYDPVNATISLFFLIFFEWITIYATAVVLNCHKRN